MRIIEIIPQLSSGGGERFTVDLCNELSRCGHNVLLVVFYPLDGFGFYSKDLDKEVMVLSLNKKFGIDLGLPMRLARIVRDFHPNVVHTHVRAINYTVLSVLRHRRIVHCHTVHSAADKEASGLVSRRVRRWLFKGRRVIPITISKESHDSFVRFYGMDAPMIFNGRNVPQDIVVSDDVQKEMESYRATRRTRLLIYLARLMAVKRQSMVTRICKRLHAEGYDFQMLFIGRDEDKVIVNDIKQMDCPCVHILGERHNPLEYLKAAGAYCLLSSYEGMPISLIEAIGVGAIPVCSPVGGIVDTVKDGVNGILAADTSEEACYYALKRYLNLDENDVATMRQKALESYAPFSMTECAEKYIALFGDLIVQKRNN